MLELVALLWSEVGLIQQFLALLLLRLHHLLVLLALPDLVRQVLEELCRAEHLL